MKLTEDNKLFKPASNDDKIARQDNELSILKAKFPLGCKVRTVGLLHTLVYGSNKGYTGIVDSYEKYGGDFKVNVKVSNDHPHSPHIFMEDPEDLEIVNEGVKKVNEDNKLFKPASEDDINSRPAPKPWPEKFAPYMGKHVVVKIGNSHNSGIISVDDMARGSQYCLIVDGYGGRNKWYLDDFDTIVNVLDESKLNEDNKLFKPASQEDLDARRPNYNRGNYKFLEYIVDPDPEASHWDIRDVGTDIDCEDSSIYFGNDGEPDFVFSKDTASVISQYLEENKELTAECQEHFEKYDTGGWSDHIQKWVESKGGKVRDSGNTCNLDNSHYWGGIFEYTEFSDINNEDGVIIMMHRGGDYRGNYGYPVVYIGDFGEVISNLDVGDSDINQEIAYMFGYDGDYDALIKDIDAYRNPEEIDPNAPRHQAIPGQMNFRLERGENPAETYYESIKR